MDEKLRLTLEQIAKEGFRDAADYDYIGARVSFRLHLRDQFYWSALQAVEKYLKAILLFNGVKVKDLSHEPKIIYDRIINKTPLNLSLTPEQIQLLLVLEKFGNNRYRTECSDLGMDVLFEFDQLIWTIRHYARSTYLKPFCEDKSEWLAKNLLPTNVQDIPTVNQLTDGELEKILGQETTAQHRQEIIWCNRYFGWAENATQMPDIEHLSSNTPIYKRDWFLKETNTVNYQKSLSDAVADFVKFPKPK